MVIGGQVGTNVSNLTNSTEFYDLTLRPNSWEMPAALHLPELAPEIVGSKIIQFDEGICEAFLISTYGKGYTCRGNYTWKYDWIGGYEWGQIYLPAVDANFLGGDTVWRIP